MHTTISQESVQPLSYASCTQSITWLSHHGDHSSACIQLPDFSGTLLVITSIIYTSTS